MADSIKFKFLPEEWRAFLNQTEVPRRKRSRKSDKNYDESMKKDPKLVQIFFGNCTPPKKKRSRVELRNSDESMKKKPKIVEIFFGNCDEEGGGGEREPKNEKKPKAKRVTEENVNPPAEMPAGMREHIRQMGGHNVQLVIEKELTTTDMNTDQGRLNLPPMQVRGDFLTEEEDKFLLKRENELNCMDVLIIGPDLSESTIRFKKWLIGARFANCLMSQWNSFAKAHHLKARNNIQLWAFRADRQDPATATTNSELCFAFVKL